MAINAVAPVAGGRGGLSVTNTSGARAGKFCSRFTQYVTHTLASSPLFELFRQFHDAHAFFARGMSAASPWSQTSFFCAPRRAVRNGCTGQLKGTRARDHVCVETDGRVKNKTHVCMGRT